MKQDRFLTVASPAMQRAAEYGLRYRATPAPGSNREQQCSLHARTSADDLRRAFGGALPEAPQNGAEVIDALIAAAEPGLVGNTEPGFHAWVMGGSHPVGVAADWLTSAWGQNAAIYQCSPAAATAEEVAAGWLLDLLDLPRESSVGFTTGATMAGFICLAAARGEVLRRAGHDFDEAGLVGVPAITAFLSDDSHVSNHSAIRYLGIGTRNVVTVETDDQGRMIPEALAERMAETAGPKIVIATAGHINSGAFDDFEAIAEIAQAHDAWLHVDSAFGLWARTSPRLRKATSGIEKADSWSTDGHKWLQVPYDSGFAIVRNAAAHRRAMDMTASYISASPEDGRNPTHFGPELSRRARGFSVWAILKALGRQGVAEMVERHCDTAGLLAQELAKLPGVALHNEVALNQVTISFHEDHYGLNLSAEMEQRLNTDPRHFFRTAEWKGETVLRISVISRETGAEEARRLAASIEGHWREMRIASYAR